MRRGGPLQGCASPLLFTAQNSACSGHFLNYLPTLCQRLLLIPPPGALPLQLSHCHRLFDVEGVLHSLDSREAQDAALEKLAPLRPVLDEAAATTAAVRNCSAYRWVDLGAFFRRAA